jgi:ubiquinone/menaquinone biosynthesis C-methylase UbiE
MRQQISSASPDRIDDFPNGGRAGGPLPGATPYQVCPPEAERCASQKIPARPAGGGEQGRVAEHFQHTAAEWKDIYDRRDLYSLQYQERMRIVLSFVDGLGVRPGARALDIGCGPGLMTLGLAERGYSVDAIDIAPAMIEMTRQLLGKSGFGHRVRAGAGDVLDLDFADNSFDLVLVVGVTEWLPSLEQAVGQIARVLRPGGFAIVTADNSWNIHSLFDPLYNPMFSFVRRRARRLLQIVRKQPPVLRYYQRSIRKVDSCLQRSQLRNVKRVTLGFGALRFFGKKLFSESTGIRIHRTLQNLADRNWPVIRSTGRIYIAVAEKPAKANLLIG